MVNQSKTCRVGLRVAAMLCVAILGMQTTRAQRAFEFSARVGANALLYTSDYGRFMPNNDIGIDFSYKYRSPYYIGWRIGLGVEVAGSTFIGAHPDKPSVGYADNYVVPRTYEPDNMLVDMNYELGSFSETQQLLFASVPLQFGLYFGNFSMFLGVRAECPVLGYYWQRIKNANMSLYYEDTHVMIGSINTGEIDPATGQPLEPEPYEPRTAAGNVTRTFNGIKPLQRGSMRWWYVNPMIDLNYSFKVGESTDFGIGIYAEYDPYGHTPEITDNTSLMTWNYTIDNQNTPVFRRDYVSVLEGNRADGVTMRPENDFSGNRIVKKYHRAAVGIRLSVSLWNVPLEDGGIYRLQGRHKRECLCDFVTF